MPYDRVIKIKHWKLYFDTFFIKDILQISHCSSISPAIFEVMKLKLLKTKKKLLNIIRIKNLYYN